MLCAEPAHYFDEGEEACHSCADESGRVLLFLGGILLLVVTLSLFARYRVLARAGLSVVWHTIGIASQRISLRTKVKISISYYQASLRIKHSSISAPSLPPPPLHVCRLSHS